MRHNHFRNGLELMARDAQEKRYAPGNHSGPDRPDKGAFGGSCNVTACQLPDSATWYNHSTQRYYCRTCAFELNRVNWDYPQMCNKDHSLCTEGQHGSR